MYIKSKAPSTKVDVVVIAALLYVAVKIKFAVVELKELNAGFSTWSFKTDIPKIPLLPKAMEPPMVADAPTVLTDISMMALNGTAVPDNADAPVVMVANKASATVPAVPILIANVDVLPSVVVQVPASVIFILVPTASLFAGSTPLESTFVSVVLIAAVLAVRVEFPVIQNILFADDCCCALLIKQPSKRNIVTVFFIINYLLLMVKRSAPLCFLMYKTALLRKA